MSENIYFKREIFEIREENSLKLYKEDILNYLNKLILFSIQKEVSDIHIEAKESLINIRVRIDGHLIKYDSINKNLGIKLITKLKIMSELDIAEKRLPQDGRFKGKYIEQKVDFRVSLIPTLFGEKCVVRILKNNLNNLEIDKLGFLEENLIVLKESLNKKSGLLIFCGPTGSGKTTTLYSIVNYLNNDNLNIITIEDPIEYQLENINQIQCKSEIGLDFITILRSVLRQDPDIILIGEIRDKETAEIALTASLTGHLVITTLHTKDSISAIDRLINFGIDKFLISSAVSLIQSQRLVRKICNDCNGNGCIKCNDGFKGRIAVEEVLTITEEIKSYIINNKIDDLKFFLKNKNFSNFYENALIKVNKGVTTKEEVYRECLI